MAIKVSTEVKASFEAEAKKVVGLLKAKNEQFNQEMNAITTFRCLRAAGVEIADDVKNQVLEILHKGGNASANRQAISGTVKGGTTLATDVADELLDM